MTPAAGVQLEGIASHLGIQTTYRGYDGRKRRARPDTLLAIAAALAGEVTGNPESLAARLGAGARDRLVEPVIVAWEGRATPIPLSHRRARVELQLEAGQSRRILVEPECQIVLPRMPLGYHRLSVRARGREESALVISAPRRAYAEPAPGRRWGAFLPLYALRSHRSWGCGDLTDLEDLRTWVASLGGSTVATLPLLAGFLDGPQQEPSPYSPASRLMWNEMFADVGRIAEFSDSQARALAASPEFTRAREALRDARLVDYAGVAALKRSVLEPMSKALTPSRAEALTRFLAERPEVQDYARFRARTERHGPWQTWPQDEPAFDRDVSSYHAYVQWVTDDQLREVSGPEAGGGLYLDLPLGVNASGYDTWRLRDGFLKGVSTGAPPDAFFSGGQDWDFPPLHPQRERERGYEYTRAYLRHHMRYASRLRVDHVMGFHRLFCIPAGFSANDGVYVRYPAEELYALLCLESRRHQTEIVGENLGIVPRYVNQAMRRHGLSGMYILPFEVDSAAGAIRPPDSTAVAALNTHDLPTFAAWWSGEDIADRQKMGLLQPAKAQREREERSQQQQTVIRTLAATANLEADAATTPEAVLRGLLRYLGRSDADLVLVNLEDLWAETEPQNVPGTWRERPNWRRKAALSLEEMQASPAIAGMLRALDEARRGRP